MNHALLPSVKDASLPKKYEAAKVAIAEASRVDECKNWADKAMALASYARQAKDKEMENTATRIRARAVRRCGELLKQIEKANGKHWKSKKGSVPPFTSREQAAGNAGLTEDQTKVAIRVANVPEQIFEDQVESEAPPTVTKLAEQGTKKQTPIYERQGMTKQAFQAGMYFRGELRRMAEKTEEYDPKDIVDGSTPEERKEMREHIEIINQFNQRIIAKL